MAIYRRLREASFDEADIRCLSAAYEAALTLMRLQDRRDPITEPLAAKVIEIFRSGESDPPKICARALRELKISLPE